MTPPAQKALGMDHHKNGIEIRVTQKRRIFSRIIMLYVCYFSYFVAFHASSSRCERVSYKYDNLSPLITSFLVCYDRLVWFGFSFLAKKLRLCIINFRHHSYTTLCFNRKIYDEFNFNIRSDAFPKETDCFLVHPPSWPPCCQPPPPSSQQ